MGKLQTYKIYKRDTFGKGHDFTSELSVSPDGMFLATLPTEVSGNLIEDGKHPILTEFDCSYGKYYRGKERRYTMAKVTPKVYGKELAKVKMVVSRLLDEYLAVSKAEEKVILYRFGHDCVYYVYEDGRIEPCGSSRHSGGEWRGHKQSSWEKYNFMVGFCAQVFNKITYTRGETSTVKYEHLPNSCHDEKMWLNSFVHVEDLVDNNNSFNQKPNHGVKEIAWSEDIEKKCYNAMLNMCKMQESLTKVFAKENPFLIDFKFMQLPEGK